ncbi:type II toxin-antitoxin system RelE/ParE family toxin [Pirellulales bacterium]|nr:type II toxin-antitoxin system RelE/ParE family toxin [Pirellulales bacterium]
MLRLIRSTQSDEDLIAIWRYIATVAGNPDAADRLLREIDRQIELLARHPYLGEVFHFPNPVTGSPTLATLGLDKRTGNWRVRRIGRTSILSSFSRLLRRISGSIKWDPAVSIERDTTCDELTASFSGAGLAR